MPRPWLTTRACNPPAVWPPGTLRSEPASAQRHRHPRNLRPKQRRLGHANVTLTLQVYARANARGGPAGCRTHGGAFPSAGLTRDRSPHPVKNRASEHPQRGSNPCRRLERGAYRPSLSCSLVSAPSLTRTNRAGSCQPNTERAISFWHKSGTITTSSRTPLGRTLEQ